MNNSKKAQFDTRYMIQLALMIAVTVVMSLTPIGYIRTPALSVTLLTIPVAVGAIILGPVGGAVCGFTFGITSFIQCFGATAFGSALLMINPFGTFITTVVTRTLEGFLTGLIFKYLHKIKATQKVSYYIASFACPVLNTILFMSSLVIFFYNSDYIQGFVNALGVKNPFTFVLAFVGVQGAIEAAICFVAASVISRTLYAVIVKKK
ncbi:MAG: ECF transporter S component [Lachnospira sp.]